MGSQKIDINVSSKEKYYIGKQVLSKTWQGQYEHVDERNLMSIDFICIMQDKLRVESYVGWILPELYQKTTAKPRDGWDENLGSSQEEDRPYSCSSKSVVRYTESKTHSLFSILKIEDSIYFIGRIFIEAQWPVQAALWLQAKRLACH